MRHVSWLTIHFRGKEENWFEATASDPSAGLVLSFFVKWAVHSVIYMHDARAVKNAYLISRVVRQPCGKAGKDWVRRIRRTNYAIVRESSTNFADGRVGCHWRRGSSLSERRTDNFLVRNEVWNCRGTLRIEGKIRTGDIRKNRPVFWDRRKVHSVEDNNRLLVLNYFWRTKNIRIF